MATGTILKLGVEQLSNNAGVSLPNSKWYIWNAGTATPASTYSDVGLTTPAAYPIVADSGGRFPITYIAVGTSTKQQVTTSAGVSVWGPYDSIPSYAIGTVVPENVAIAQGRLTLTTGTPVTVTDVTAATTVFYTPYIGAQIALYDTTAAAWSRVTFAETSLALTGLAAGKNYDLFGFLSSGVLALESLVWTSDTVRATALALQDSVLVKSGQPSRRYLGTFRTTAVIGQCEDSLTKRFCWNYYNQVRRPMRRLEGTANWTYTTATLRQANAAAANQLDMVIGVAEVMADIAVFCTVSNNSGVANTFMSVGIGENSTTTDATGTLYTAGNSGATANQHYSVQASLVSYPAVGRTFYAWLEQSVANVTTTFFGVSGINMQSGIRGSIDG